MREWMLASARSETELRVGDWGPGSGVNLGQKEGHIFRGTLALGASWGVVLGPRMGKPSGGSEKPKGLQTDTWLKQQMVGSRKERRQVKPGKDGERTE